MHYYYQRICAQCHALLTLFLAIVGKHLTAEEIFDSDQKQNLPTATRRSSGEAMMSSDEATMRRSSGEVMTRKNSREATTSSGKAKTSCTVARWGCAAREVVVQRQDVAVRSGE
ncbi:hypothetical protein ACOSQ3_014109 [Xanthoceras sorbifolium]